MLSFPSLLAQVAIATPAAPADVPSVEVASVWDFVLKGGIMMIPIGLCSLVALSVLFDRLVHLRKRVILPPGLAGEITRTYDKGRGAAAAVEQCTKNGSSLAMILAAALRRAGRARDSVERAVQEAAERERVRMRRFLRVLSVIASVAPLLGLLGTIIGMIMAFQTVASSGEALGKTELLAQGIYQAMITTAGGLSVAIPVLIAYHWLVARVQQRMLDLDDAVVAFIDALGLVADEPRATTAAPVIEVTANGAASRPAAPAAAAATVEAGAPS